MVRLETTTSSGKVFMSPFVYTRIEAEKIIARLHIWHINIKTNLPRIRLIEVKEEDCPREAIFRSSWRDSSIDRKIKRAERAWANMGG